MSASVMILTQFRSWDGKTRAAAKGTKEKEQN